MSESHRRKNLKDYPTLSSMSVDEQKAALRAWEEADATKNGHCEDDGFRRNVRLNPKRPTKPPKEPLENRRFEVSSVSSDVGQGIEAYQGFPVDALPPGIRAMVRQGAVSLGCDPAYLALPALSVAASCIGNTRTIRLKRGWEEPSILWTAIVGYSGTLKSPAYDRVLGRLFGIQERFSLDYRRASENYKAEIEEFNSSRKKAYIATKPTPPTLRRVVCSDTTIEKLAEILEDNPRGILVARDELAGWLGSFTRYKSSGGSDCPAWLELNRAGTLMIDRKTGERRHIFVKRASACVTGGIQPGVLVKALSSDLMDSGLAARLLLCHPPRLPKHWTDAEIDPATEQNYQDLLDKLLALDFYTTSEGESVPFSLKLSAEAKEVWVKWYNEWALEQAAVEGELAAAYSKLEGFSARFALLAHVAGYVASGSSDLVPVGAESILDGIKLAKWFAHEARRVYAMLGESESSRVSRTLVEYISSRGGEMSVKNLQRSNGRKYPRSEDAMMALDDLAKAGLAFWEERVSGQSGGRPSHVLILRPTSDETDETSK